MYYLKNALNTNQSFFLYPFYSIGSMGDDFRSTYLDNNHVTDPYTCTGIFRTIASSRLSYQLNLLGPNMVIDTACSSSAIAIHLACQGLKSGICSLSPLSLSLLSHPPKHPLSLSLSLLYFTVYSFNKF